MMHITNGIREFQGMAEEEKKVNRGMVTVKVENIVYERESQNVSWDNSIELRKELKLTDLASVLTNLKSGPSKCIFSPFIA